MTLWSRFRSWLRTTVRRSRMESDMEAELRFHIAAYAEDLVRMGVPQQEAMRRARMEFGGIERTKEECREARGVTCLESLTQDIRYGLRVLRKSPGFTAVAVLTLALGIGSNTAVFSAIQTVLLRPYPFRNPNRLVLLWSTNGPSHSTDGVSGPDYLDYKSQSRCFERIGAYVFREPADLSIGGHTQRVWTMFATGSVLATLGIEPALGRSFLPEEETSDSHATLLSYALWQSQFGGSPEALGRTIMVDGHLREIVGILPPQFDPPNEDDPIGVVLPVPWDSSIYRDRANNRLLVVARLMPNMNQSRAQSDVNVIASRLASAHPDSNRDRGALVTPINQEDAYLRDPLWALFGAVSFVLLIACGNISGLLLARGLARRKEFAVRVALGAGRSRVVRQMFTESILLALFGGGIGLAAAWEGTRILRATGAATLPALKNLRVDTSTAIFAFLVSLAAAIIFGLLPAWKIAGLDVNRALKGDALLSSQGFRPAQLRSFLIATQVSLAVVVLCGAGILLRSLYDLATTSPGFNVNHLLTADLSKSASPAAQVAFYNQLLARVSSIPGVMAAAATSAPPLGSDAVAPMPPFDIPGTALSGSRQAAMLRVVTPGYFHAMAVPILAGREFSPQDSSASPRVAIINDMIARQYFASRPAVGQELAFYPLRYPARFTPQPGIVRIVGVIAGLKHWFTGGWPHEDPEIYLPYTQSPVADMMLVARLDERTPGVARELQDRVNALDRGALLDDPDTMRAQFSATIAPKRFYPELLAVFASISLVLASIGIYGVVSYWVRERTQEIGIRMALGARPLDVLRLVILQGLVSVLIGCAIGLAAAFALTRFLRNLLYGIGPRDPGTFVAVAILLVVVALVACYIPARRAMRVDPMIALRYE